VGTLINRSKYPLESGSEIGVYLQKNRIKYWFKSDWRIILFCVLNYKYPKLVISFCLCLFLVCVNALQITRNEVPRGCSCWWHLKHANCMLDSTMHLIQLAQNLRANNIFSSSLHFRTNRSPAVSSFLVVNTQDRN
jgi:hypothetical protein